MTHPRRVTVDGVALEARALMLSRRSIKAATKEGLLRLAMSMIDLTTLEGKDSPEKVRSLCRKAVRPCERDEDVLGYRVPAVAAVCVYPQLVPVAAEALDSLGARGRVKLASVATGFPSGQYPLDVRLEDTRRAVAAGADEIDMVINRGAFLAGRYAEVHGEIRHVKEACGAAHLKVILETGELETYDNMRFASDLAIAAGADFVKTSTGKVQPAATPASTLVLLESVRDEAMRGGRIVGVKPAGGIRTAKQAVQTLVLVAETMHGVGPEHGVNPWLTPEFFRIGASTLANDILRQLFRLKRGRYEAAYEFSEA